MGNAEITLNFPHSLKLRDVAMTHVIGQPRPYLRGFCKQVGQPLNGQWLIR
jgi:hypothetical protein